MTKLPDPPKVSDKPPDSEEPNPWAFAPKAPSQQPNAQGPVEKPGEPMAVTFRTIPPASEPEPQAKKGKPEGTPGRGPDPDHKPGEGRGPPPKVQPLKK